MRLSYPIILVCSALSLGIGGDCSRARVESMNTMNEGVTAAQRKNFGDAIQLLNRAGAIDHGNDRVFWNLAIVYMEMRKFDEARENLTKAIAQQPDSPGYYEKLGTVLIQLQDWDGAQAAFLKAIELDDSLFKAYYKLARVAEQRDDPQSALKYYTDAIKSGPRFLEAYSSLGRLYADLGYLDQSKQVLQEALKVALPGTAEEADVHHLLGTVYQEQRDYDAAISEFKRALEVVPGMRDALFSLGWTYSLVGNIEEARRFLQKFVDVAGSEAPAHYVKAARDKLSEMQEGF